MNEENTCMYRGWKKSQIDAVINDEDIWKDEVRERLYEFWSNTEPNVCCGVGHLIDDELYDTAMENTPYDDELIHRAVQDSNPNWDIDTDSAQALLKDLQFAHDNIEVQNWEVHFGVMGSLFNEDGSYAG